MLLQNVQQVGQWKAAARLQFTLALYFNMKHLILLILILTLVGCDSFPRASYSLGSFSQYSAEGEIKALCSQLEIIAKNNSLESREPERPETQCYFSESEINSVVLGARKLNEQLVIDVQAFNYNKEFRAINTQIKKMLDQVYPDRYLHVSD